MKAMGGTDIVVAEFGRSSHVLPIALFANRPIFDDREWDLLAAGLNRLGDIAAGSGMRLCYHHHMGHGRDDPGGHRPADGDDEPRYRPPAAGHGPPGVRRGRPARRPPRPTPAASSTFTSRTSARTWSARSARRTCRSRRRIEAGVFTVPGDGSIDFVPILEALAGAGYEGWLVVEAEQDPAKANPLEYAIMARAYLREVLGW